MSQQFKVPQGLPIQPIQPRQAPKTRPVPGKDGSFAQILDTKLRQSTVKFSAHANKRLEARNIQLTEQQLNTLEEAVEKARSKGGRETLILLDNIALVVSVANRTVITAMDGENLKDNVFTHIDSAVIT
ncbi:MAG: TIGR02530 family flagellar biosynthesis protein [Syntrophomonadaceae bacterium]|jgi:flagellar operon protein|nr:TIGR02530 family flagellar biosynthesis protein [Bacillota bacterium]